MPRELQWRRELQLRFWMVPVPSGCNAGHLLSHNVIGQKRFQSSGSPRTLGHASLEQGFYGCQLGTKCSVVHAK
jgi:hypothetical protein